MFSYDHFIDNEVTPTCAPAPIHNFLLEKMVDGSYRPYKRRESSVGPPVLFTREFSLDEDNETNQWYPNFIILLIRGLYRFLIYVTYGQENFSLVSSRTP